MTLGQDGILYTYTPPHTRHFIIKACYGGRVGISFREFESSASKTILNLIDLVELPIQKKYVS